MVTQWKPISSSGPLKEADFQLSAGGNWLYWTLERQHVYFHHFAMDHFLQFCDISFSGSTLKFMSLTIYDSILYGWLDSDGLSSFLGSKIGKSLQF